MELHKYDNKCVRITDNFGNVFEGLCSYHNADYNEHEYGEKEDSLQILDFIFYESLITEIEILEDITGPYGKFSDSFGLIEELNVKDGIISIREVLFSEEYIHIYRILFCIDKYLEDNLLDKEEIIKALKELLLMPVENNVREKVEELIAKWD